ncbi:probable G-protein coupled receptor 139 [Hemiscyllium ocellatum]|uniref:probable G-protein coupled receptor 139 n=1 Tax=Hemiscyllium ocellatum TaxID=170820 RepID=UPI0029664E13|nr:probable G-protein coupled receptor 139 [Hemiscyllium ocellatum]
MHEPVIAPFFVVFYSILAAISAPANLLAFIILLRGRCGLSRGITYYLVAIAVSDFLVITTAVILNRISRICFRKSLFSTTPACTLSVVLVNASLDCSVWLTVAFTIDRFAAICYQRQKTRFSNEKTALLVIGMICVLCSVKTIPLYFAFLPLFILDGVSWFCNIKASFYTWPVWQAYDWLFRIMTPFLPFFVILLLNILTIRQIIAANRARRRLWGAENRQDPEMANRQRSIVLLFAISLSFLLMLSPVVGHFIYVCLKAKSDFDGLDFRNPKYIFEESTNILQLLSSCNNVFIYSVSQNLF